MDNCATHSADEAARLAEARKEYRHSYQYTVRLHGAQLGYVGRIGVSGQRLEGWHVWGPNWEPLMAGFARMRDAVEWLARTDAGIAAQHDWQARLARIGGAA